MNVLKYVLRAIYVLHSLMPLLSCKELTCPLLLILCPNTQTCLPIFILAFIRAVSLYIVSFLNMTRRFNMAVSWMCVVNEV